MKTLFPVIIDSCPVYLESGDTRCSLLLTPIGVHTLLRLINEQLSTVTEEPLSVVGLSEGGEADAARLRELVHLDTVTTPSNAAELVEKLEPSDWLLLIDPRTWVARPAALRELVEDVAESREVRHLVAMDDGDGGTREFLQMDQDGRVRRIQRYYGGVTWLRTSNVAASLVPASVARGLSGGDFSDLSAFREAIMRLGVVSRDIGLRAGAFDLRVPRGLLRLCEEELAGQADREPPAGYRADESGVWIAPNCEVHPNACLRGSVVLNAGARVDEGATLVGPVVLGENSHVQRDVTLAECIVTPDTTIGGASRHHGQVLPLVGESEDGGAGVDADAGGPLHHAYSQEPESVRDGVRTRGRYMGIKRTLEGAVALVSLITLSPLLALTALAVKLGSHGPIFFSHEREGKDGVPFRCWKFRTMVADAHRQQRALYQANAVDGPQFKMESDPRVTWLGGWLRRLNIDELPQLYNVLVGEMSLIGPRPSPFRENQICVPWREARLAVRPGITGLWQICRHEREAGDFHQWIHYDMLYVRHMSFWLDAKILLTTVFTLGGRKSVPASWLVPATPLQAEVKPPSPVLSGRARHGAVPMRDGVSVGLRGEGDEVTMALKDEAARAEWIASLRALSIRALTNMYHPDRRVFAFRARQTDDGHRLEGESPRYTAIAALGLAGETDATVREVLHGDDLYTVVDELISRCMSEKVTNLGDVALTYWAAKTIDAGRSKHLFGKLESLLRGGDDHETVEVAWVVSSLCEGRPTDRERAFRDEALSRLISAYRPESNLFAHWTGSASLGLRRHVSCFADLVYPIQALARHHTTTGDEDSLQIANDCAECMCDLMGPAGQWWWHYDARTGQVVEYYPVYSVHQDAMAPMALLDLAEAGGRDHEDAINRGLDWLASSPELDGASLVDETAGMIWRKVARREPRKLVRSAQAIASRIHPRLRVPGTDRFFTSDAIDDECRPYHLGWLLYAWSRRRMMIEGTDEGTSDERSNERTSAETTGSGD